MSNLAIFASGSGTNAENIISHFKQNENFNISAILSNNKNAYVVQRAINHNIDYHVFNRNEFYNSDEILSFLNAKNIDFIVLAGFLWLIPDYLLKAYPNKIINIHPALLPKYGGKGMYGMRVHEAVVLNKEKETGITIHYVNENYDEGDIVFQAQCPVNNSDSPEAVAEKVHELEYRHFPKVIENLLQKL